MFVIDFSNVSSISIFILRIITWHQNIIITIIKYMHTIIKVTWFLGLIYVGNVLRIS